MRRLAAVLVVVASFATAQASAQPPAGLELGDPCVEPERTIPLAFDLYAGRVSDDALPLVERLAESLRACPTRAFELQVHTDTVRLASFNARQSAAVARHLRELLVARGVAASRIAPCGYGESRPLGGSPSWRGSPNERLVLRALSGPAAQHRCPEA